MCSGVVGALKWSHLREMWRFCASFIYSSTEALGRWLARSAPDGQSGDTSRPPSSSEYVSQRQSVVTHMTHLFDEVTKDRWISATAPTCLVRHVEDDGQSAFDEESQIIKLTEDIVRFLGPRMAERWTFAPLKHTRSSSQW